MLVGEHDDRVRLVAAEQADLLHDVASGRFAVDQDHVRAYCGYTRRQVDGQAGLVDHLEAGFGQRALQAADLLRGVVDQENAQHVQNSCGSEGQ
ncbi:hypothetical protein D9M71_574740 [compost metagenome]